MALAAVAAALCVASALSALLVFFPVFGRLDSLVYDAWMRANGPTKPHPGIIIVEIDEKSLAALGQWPWPRNLLGDLARKIIDGGAAAVAFDILLPEEDRSSPAFVDRQTRLRYGVPLNLAGLPPEALDNDRYFRDLVKDRPVVLGAFADFSARGKMPKTLPKATGLAERTPAGAPAPKDRLPQASGLVAPLELFTEAAPIGLINASVQDDGVVRAIPLIANVGGNIYAALSVRSLMAALGVKTLRLDSDKDGLAELRLGQIKIPVGHDGSFRALYRGPGRTYPYVSAVDVLKGEISPETFKNRVVLIGPTAAGLLDLRSTPYDPATPGVEVHANVIDNILSGENIRVPAYAAGLQICLVYFCSLLGAAIFGLLPPAGYAALAISSIAAALWASWHFFEAGYFISPVNAILALLLMGALIIPWRFRREQKAKKRIRQAFSRYVAPEVVSRIVARGLNPLGGEQKPLTVMFTDIRGFTSISEKMSPDKIVKLLNSYFTAMTACVIQNGGTLDKFIGDALMAFWNAPLDVPDHERKAVLAAIAMQKKLEELRPELLREFGVELRMGAGIHAGSVQVGNMGSRDLLNYTCIGDNVNLASRLEGLCKRYGVGIVASLDIRQACGNALRFRMLDRITVKGSTRPLEIFTPLEASEESSEEFEARWGEALNAYFKGDFGLAEKLFEKLASISPYSVGARLFIERCRVLIATPPADWRGVWAFDAK